MANRGLYERTVEVWGKWYKVIVQQRSKTVWVVVGEYEGKLIETNDRSETTALRRWLEAARYRDNL